jgi:hypothetical protein
MQESGELLRRHSWVGGAIRAEDGDAQSHMTHGAIGACDGEVLTALAIGHAQIAKRQDGRALA